MTPDQTTELAELAFNTRQTVPACINGMYVVSPDELRRFATLVADAATAPLHARIAELEAENKQLRILASGGIDLFERYSTFKTKCEELEAMLDAVGAGGVGESIKPQIRDDTAPAAWAIYSDDGTAIRLWSRCKSSAQDAADKFGLPLVPLYAAPQPARQPLTDSQVKELAKKHPAEDLCRWSYGMGIKDAEAAHGITGGQP